MNRIHPTLRRLAIPVLLMLACAACGDEKTENDLGPLVATVTVTAGATDPNVFFQPSNLDVPGDDVVVLDVMLQSTANITFSAFTMEIHFEKTLLQVGQVDLTATPLGDCTSSTGLHPICADNVHSTTDPANDTGILLLGVGAQSGGANASVTGLVKLFTIRFVGAALGVSDVTLLKGAGSGDCEILDTVSTPPVDFGVSCDGTAEITVTR